MAQDTAAVRYGHATRVFYSVSMADRHDLRVATLGPSPSFETLDGAGGTGGRTTHDVGSDVSAAVFHGAIHVFYRDDTTGDLRHAWFDGSTWRFETLDGASSLGGRVDADLGQRSEATRYAGRLEVFYLVPATADVRRASYDGSTWTLSTIDGDSTASGHTIHEVGFNLQVAVWGGSLHVLYYERDPAYGDLLGWVREARLTGTSWSYAQAFRVNSIGPGKTLGVGVVGPSEVYVAYNTTIQDVSRLRRRLWDGASWTGGTDILVQGLGTGIAFPVVFVVTDGVTSLAYGGQSWGAGYLTWSGGDPTTQSAYPLSGVPTSAVVIGGTRAHIFWGGGEPEGCCDSLLVRTTGP